MQNLKLRPFRKEDLMLISEWLKDDAAGMKFLPSYASPEKWRHLINGKDRLLYIAELEDEPVGFFDLEINGSIGYFVVYVAPAHRNRGIAKRILTEAEELDVIRRLSALEVGVEKDNRYSIELLKGAGFMEDGEDKDGMIQFRKALAHQRMLK